MSVDTNRLQVQFNIEAIRRDFVFIRFERQAKLKNWIGAEQLDLLLGKDFNAFSTMFQYGKFAYVMFKKPIDVHELLLRMRSNELFADDAVIEVLPTDDENNNQDCIRGEWLAQILLNSVSSSRSRFPQYQFCNLTGSLLIVLKPTSKKYIDAANITIENGWLLVSKVKRYRSLIDIKSELKIISAQKRKKELTNALDKPNYTYKNDTGALIRHLKKDGTPDSKSTFVECGLTGKRVSLPFLEFKNLDAFQRSRAGIFHVVLNLIREKISKYITVELSQRVIDDKCILETSLIKDTEKVRDLLSDKIIHIVDKLNDKESKTTVENLKKLIKESKAFSSAKITDGKNDNSNSLNIRIVHEKSYYKQDEQKDDYASSDTKIIRQNITIESLNASENWKSVITTCIKELLIKQDINNCKFSLFNWSNLQLSGVWTFAVLEQENNRVVFMEVETNGSFKFFDYSDLNLLTWERFDKYRTALTIDRKDKKLSLEGVVVSSEGDINQIFRTEEITMPNLEEIHSILREKDSELPESISTGNALSKIVHQYLKTYTVTNQEKFEVLIDSLNQVGQQNISKLVFYDLIKNKLGSAIGSANTKDSIQLRDYMLEKFGVRFIVTKDKETTEELFNSSVDIKYFGESEREAYYFVGNSRASIQSSFKDSCHLRKITVLPDSKDKLVFSKLLPTMDVDFVRTGQSTVIPFPFKYIREYIKFTNNKQ